MFASKNRFKRQFLPTTDALGQCPGLYHFDLFVNYVIHYYIFVSNLFAVSAESCFMSTNKINMMEVLNSRFLPPASLRGFFGG